VHHLDIWIKVDQLDDTCFIMSIYCSTCFGCINIRNMLSSPIRIRFTNAKQAKIIHESSRKFLKMDVLTSETCWAVNWHNKASVIKLVYLYSNIRMMHDPIRIRFTNAKQAKIIHESSRKLLKKDVLISETCWAVNWHNKASVIKLVYLYSNNIHSVSSLYRLCLAIGSNAIRRRNFSNLI